MRQELDEQICNECPLLFRDRGADIGKSAMAWGFPHSGWFRIIYDTSKKIEKILKTYKEENPNKDLPTSAQVKNKYGFLRWYIAIPDDFPPKLKKRIYILIGEAEEASVYICEACGIGRLANEGMSSRCEDCSSKSYWGEEN